MEANTITKEFLESLGFKELQLSEEQVKKHGSQFNLILGNQCLGVVLQKDRPIVIILRRNNSFDFVKFYGIAGISGLVTLIHLISIEPYDAN